ncbi:MAG: hypothetical protein U0Y82_07660 [Thermoleophilia bacterium]
MGGQEYRLVPEAVRTSLSDTAPMLWGFPVHVLQGERTVCIKTCFVGRVSVHARDPEAPDGPSDRLIPIVYELALANVRKRIEAGELDDELVFA